jgi:uncharacterized protein
MKYIQFEGMRIPVLDYASQGNGGLGIRDSGKTYTFTYIAEQLIKAGIPFVAFDPIGVWRWLRVGKNGKPGFPVVVAGGKSGDLPLTPQSAPDIVRSAMRENVCLVIDLYDIHLSKADWSRIVESSIRVLLYENEGYGLRHIFLEEAAEFAPQIIRDNQSKVYAEVEKLARMGGNSRLGYTLINQRAEEVNKAVLELCDCLILHRQKGRNSLNALSKWLDVADVADYKSIAKSLPKLAQGECWIWAAGSDEPVRVKVPEKDTVHPDRRALQSAQGNVARTDVSEFVKNMSASLEKHLAEAKENDPAELKRQNAQLQRRIAELEQSKPAPEVKIVERAVFKDGDLERLEVVSKEILEAVRGASSVNDAARYSRPSPESGRRGPYGEIVPTIKLVGKGNGKDVYDHAIEVANDAFKLGGPHKKFLTVLAMYPQGRTDEQIAVLCGLKSGSGHFNNVRSALMGQGMVEGNKDCRRITQSGYEWLGPFEPLPTGEALRDYWMNKLQAPAAKLLKVFVDHWPHEISIDQAQEWAGFTPGTGHANNQVSALRTRELIADSRMRGHAKASDDLFD